MNQPESISKLRREIRSAAKSIIPELLGRASTPMEIRAVRDGFRNRMPHLANDSIRCPPGSCNSKHPLWHHQVSWALTDLKEKGIVERSGRGLWTLRQTASSTQNRFGHSHRDTRPDSASTVDHRVREDNPTHVQILARLKEMNEKQFEHFVGRLLTELGFEDVQVVGRPGDGGVDVRCLLQAPLIGAPISVTCQVKRHASNVGPSAVGDLRGRWGHKEDRLILVNTGGFTSGAKEAAAEPGAKEISLVSGEDLARLMIEKGIGVLKERVVVEELDEAFWEDLLR